MAKKREWMEEGGKKNGQNTVRLKFETKDTTANVDTREDQLFKAKKKSKWIPGRKKIRRQQDLKGTRE